MWSYFMAFKKTYYIINNSIQRSVLCKNKKEGFTIVELMIAISVFSVVMIIATTGILLIARQYQSGVTKTAMQSATRDIHQKISDSIKYGKELILFSNVDGFTGMCVGNERYYYKIPNKADGTNITNGSDFGSMGNLFYEKKSSGEYNSSNCSSTLSTDASTLLPSGAKVAHFYVDTTNNKIDTTFVKGDYDLFDLPSTPAGLQCKSGVGNEWCSVVSLSSIVNPRL